jgi:small GTP-binding protein
MTNKKQLKMINEAKEKGQTKLDLSHNGLKELLPELFQLTNLTELNLSWNNLKILPSEILQLNNLTALDLSDNHLAKLPSEVFQLTKLNRLILVRNRFIRLPPEICQLENLEVLDLRSNSLLTIPPELFQLKNLKKLYLWNNQIATLPSEISQLENLEVLALSRNQLTTLPPEICKLTKLKELRIDDNPLTTPPPEIAEKGIEEIRQYFEALYKDTQPLNEVKLILVGEGAAGKTSLRRRLLNEPFSKNESTTHGINIQGWEQEVGGRTIRINIWDFGGQEILHATHQFFLSRRSLYVLVLDARRDDKTEYWLRHIEAFGGDSPVLVVLNKHDENPTFDVNRSFLRKKYPSIQNFFFTSCETQEGIPEFKKELLDGLAKVEMIGISWPGSWFAVKRRLEQMDKAYISYKDYKQYCEDAGITDEKNQETLAEFLHDLGVAVHFNGYILDAMHVLNPAWVTNAVYKIITAKRMADNKGFLCLKCLGEILPPGKGDKLSCPPETYPYIMHLMEKFELCYPVGEEEVLIPQLLPVPESEFTFDYSGALSFVLYYPDFLPPSIFPRFMVKVHKDIEDNLRWRTGVVLTDTMSGARAVIKADVEARRINIWVQGERRREYLHYLRYSLAGIKNSFEKLTVSERVPMPDDPGGSADYENLLDLLDAGSDVFIPIGSKKRYSVKELLGLVQPKDKDELTELMRKLNVHLDEKESGTEIAASLFELKPNIFGIGFNLNELFARILAWGKQWQQHPRQ